MLSKITEGRAWLFGFLAGDGTVLQDGSHGAGFNTDPELVAQIICVLEEGYRASPTARYKDRPGRKRLWTVRFGRAVAEDLLGHCSRWDTMNWRVPDSVKSASPGARAAYLRGFYDAEGTPYGSPKWRITVSSANEGGARDILELLASIAIEGRFYSYPRKEGEADAHIVSVHKRSEAIRFAKTVGFCATSKTERLAGIESAPYGKAPRWESLLPIIHSKRSAGMKLCEIDAELGLYKRESSAALVWDRRKKGVKTRRDSLGPLYQEVALLKDHGLAYSQVAEALKVPAHRVHAALAWKRKQDGIPRKPKGTKYRDRIQEIRAAGLEGEAAPVVARALGLAEYQVQRARKWCAEQDGVYSKRIRLADHEDTIRRMLRDGSPQKDVAAALGCSQAAVSVFRKRRGI